MTIEEGKKAPAFTLKDQNETAVSLSDFKGKTVIVYFYPRDNTPGCTKEAIGFRDLWQQFEALDVIVLGVSPDNAQSHVKFIKGQALPFTLLSDPDKKVMQAYDAYGEKMLYGKKSIGVIRSTVIVGPDGKVVKHWKKVPKAADHPAKILAFLEKTG
ncbi:thioredoxin-dependent thiol peroxidase [bacterium]|nr:thioredoxin-dependent thiol peroxidase [bacterium]